MSNVPSIQAILMFFSGLESPHKPSLNLHPEQYLVIHHKFHYLHQCCFAWDMNEAVHQKTRWMPKEWRDGGLVSSWNIDAPNCSDTARQADVRDGQSCTVESLGSFCSREWERRRSSNERWWKWRIGQESMTDIRPFQSNGTIYIYEFLIFITWKHNKCVVIE